jgi:hypothetical protein
MEGGNDEKELYRIGKDEFCALIFCVCCFSLACAGVTRIVFVCLLFCVFS